MYGSTEFDDGRVPPHGVGCVWAGRVELGEWRQRRVELGDPFGCSAVVAVPLDAVRDARPIEAQLVQQPRPVVVAVERPTEGSSCGRIVRDRDEPFGQPVQLVGRQLVHGSVVQHVPADGGGLVHGDGVRWWTVQRIDGDVPARTLAVEHQREPQVGRVQPDVDRVVQTAVPEQAVEDRQPLEVEAGTSRSDGRHGVGALDVVARQRGQLLAGSSHRPAKREHQVAVEAQVRHQRAAAPAASVSSSSARRSSAPLARSGRRQHGEAPTQRGQVVAASGGSEPDPHIRARRAGAGRRLRWSRWNRRGGAGRGRGGAAHRPRREVSSCINDAQRRRSNRKTCRSIAGSRQNGATTEVMGEMGGLASTKPSPTTTKPCAA